MRKTNLIFIFMLICINQLYCAAKSVDDVTTEDFLSKYNNTVSANCFYKSLYLKVIFLFN